MITPDGKHCTIPGIVVWDGITTPDTDNAVGKPKYSCKIVVDPNAPELAELQHLATEELNSGIFKGVMPHGGLWIMAPVQPTDKFNIDGMFNNFMWLNASTYNGQPQVYDQNGQLIPPMQLASVIYPGSKVELLVEAYCYDKQSKGIKPSLAGIRIIDATAPRLSISGSSIDVASVFGAPGGQQAAPINNTPGPNAAPVVTQPNVVQPVVDPLAAPGAPPVVAVPGNVTPNVNYTQP